MQIYKHWFPKQENMASLVAYDDSDSEDESLNQSKTVTDSHKEGKPKQEAGVSSHYGLLPSPYTIPLGMGQCGNDTAVEHHKHHIPKSTSYVEKSPSSVSRHLQQQSHFDREKQYFGSNKVIHVPDTLEKFSAQQICPQAPQLSSHVGTSATKRHQTTPPGFRPYIPKRQRLATPVQKVDTKSSEDNVPMAQDGTVRMLSEVSERVKPYLVCTPGRAEIPRRLLMSLAGHQGPVNTVQWCPVPPLSHLLLSASMDKTAKVWDGVESGQCLKVYSCHAGAIRDACWTPCGRRILTGSFDNTAMIIDVETGQYTAKVENQFKVMCVAIQPSDPDVFLCGGYSSVVKAWDSRISKVVKEYKAGIQQTLDILFLRGGAEFITTTDSVSRDSAERTLIAWDYQTTAKVSNQIYHERYTCPSLALHPAEEYFVAQTNGNYMAMFSSQRPYRMNKRRRYEGHKVEGYAVQCEFSLDGTLLASGSSTGSAHFYDYQSARVLHTLHAHSQPCLCVSLHSVLPATAATCDWGGEIKVWH